MSAAPGLRLLGSARLEDGKPLFDEVAFEAVGAGWTCLLGPSGVGKSTLLRLCAGLPSGAAFDGQIVAEDGGLVATRVAWMAQDDLLLPWLDVGQNVSLGARLRGASVAEVALAELLETVGLGPHRHKRPAQLSGGQRQRAALARTLREDRPFVLLDEPFSALDARTRSQMQDLAFAALGGRTVVLVTHDPAEAARLASRIYLMEDSGLRAVPVPAAPPIRAVDDADVLHRQAALLAHMRAAA